VRKVKGEDNPADVFTKHLPSREKVDQLVRLLGCRFDSGRPDASPEMRRERLTQQTLGQAMGETARTTTATTTCRRAFDGEYDEDVDYVMQCIGEAGTAREGVLPHLHSHDEIERLFPGMPLLGDDDDLVGLDYRAPGDRTDVEDYGEVLAEEILRRARQEGRRRKVSTTPC
jgi:hypothetical protein